MRNNYCDLNGCHNQRIEGRDYCRRHLEELQEVENQRENIKYWQNQLKAGLIETIQNPDRFNEFIGALDEYIDARINALK